eukprot:2305609-Pleurochrysis_carterae.AAC.3
MAHALAHALVNDHRLVAARVGDGPVEHRRDRRLECRDRRLQFGLVDAEPRAHLPDLGQGRADGRQLGRRLRRARAVGLAAAGERAKLRVETVALLRHKRQHENLLER